MAAKRKHKKLIIGIIAAVVVIAGALFIFAPKGPKPPEVTVAKVTKRDITSQVTASGTVAPKVEVTISSEVAGEVVELPVNDGDRVKKGQLLVRIDTETLQLQVAQKEAGLAATKASADKIKSQMERTDQQLKDQERLFESKYISEDALREARMNAEVNHASYTAALADIVQQQKSLDESKKNLKKAIIYSPMDGIVSSRSVELGDRVVGTGDYSGTEIMKVADFGVMNVEIDVNETDVVNVKVGDKASIAIDAIPNTSFPGSVVEIASSATTSTSTENAVTFLVKVHIDQNDERIRPGMTATADIDTGHVDDVIAVPLQSVTVRDKQTVAKALGKHDIEAPVATDNVTTERKDTKRTRKELDNLQRVVFIHKNGKVFIREVKTGLSDNRYMEIKEGISTGEEVVSGSYNAIARELNNDMTVKVAKETPSGANGKGGDKGPGPR
jgi:HlyD family secretion protein